MRLFLLFFLPFYLYASEVKVQILGSGGPELDKRASASYLIWIDNKAKILVDFGGGAFVRLGESGAHIEDIDLILLSHFHIDHVVDFAALVKASYFSNAHKTIKVFGPSSNHHFPNTKEFLKGQLDNSDVYSYMSDVLNTNSDCISFKPYVFNADINKEVRHIKHEDVSISLIGVNHGNVPSLAYKITIGNKSILFSSDTSGKTNNLVKLGKNSDLFIAHHAIPEDASQAAKNLHMTPSRIGTIAANIKVGKLLLSHRMKRTLGKEKCSIKLIKESFSGEIILAEDLLIIPLLKK